MCAWKDRRTRFRKKALSCLVKSGAYIFRKRRYSLVLVRKSGAYIHRCAIQRHFGNLKFALASRFSQVIIQQLILSGWVASPLRFRRAKWCCTSIGGVTVAERTTHVHANHGYTITPVLGKHSACSLKNIGCGACHQLRTHAAILRRMIRSREGLLFSAGANIKRACGRASLNSCRMHAHRCVLVFRRGW